MATAVAASGSRSASGSGAETVSRAGSRRGSGVASASNSESGSPESSCWTAGASAAATATGSIAGEGIGVDSTDRFQGEFCRSLEFDRRLKDRFVLGNGLGNGCGFGRWLGSRFELGLCLRSRFGLGDFGMGELGERFWGRCGLKQVRSFNWLGIGSGFDCALDCRWRLRLR